MNRNTSIPKSQTSDTLVTSVNVTGDTPHSALLTIQATSGLDPPSTQEGSGSLPPASTALDHQVIEVEIPPTVDTLFQGMLQEEGVSLSQEPRNTAPATSVPTSVEIGPVDADDRDVSSQSLSSSAFTPLVASHCTTQGQQFALQPPMSVLPQTGFRLPQPF